MAWFCCRLIAPRADFPAAMTPAEQEAMGAHGAYWAGRAAAGIAIAVGPVFAPEGAFGLGFGHGIDPMPGQLHR